MKLLREMTIRKLVLLSWALPGALVVLASLVIFSVMGWVDYQRSISRIQDDLAAQARIASRRLSAEILLGQSGAVESVARTLERELDINRIEVLSGQPPCSIAEITEGVCAKLKNSNLSVLRSVEHTLKPNYVILSRAVPSFWAFLNFTLFIWSALPLVLLVGIGLIFQKALLDHFLVRPIGSLVDTTVDAKDPPAHWPAEIQDISRRLASSFEDRDQAIFGRIAGGVIHDLKTLLQSIRIGQELVSESPDGSPKRQQRLESLLKTVTLNVPKMLKIIETTLDGSREIQVRFTDQDLNKTIKSAIEANVPFAKTRQVLIQPHTSIPVAVPHDSLQLERALTNLIKNAIEAFDEHEKASADSISLVRVSADYAGHGKVLVSVEDSGPGLPHGTDRAFRILRSTKPHGSGLGLSVARKIIEAHGGSIEAGVSEQLMGAAFVIELPRSDRGLV